MSYHGATGTGSYGTAVPDALRSPRFGMLRHGFFLGSESRERLKDPYKLMAGMDTVHISTISSNKKYDTSVYKY